MAPVGPPPAWTAPTTVAGPPSSAGYGGDGRPALLDAEPGPGIGEVVSAPPAGYGTRPSTPDPRPTRKPRRDDCAELRAECVRLREQADGTIAAAAQAAKDAEEAHARYVEAQKATEEATRAYEAAVAASAAAAAELQGLERVTTEDQRRLEQETTHAAFTAYRRGDISSEQLREVFRRAEGWTPQQDQLSRDALTRRAEEGEAIRGREAAIAAEHAAGEHARITAISARALDEEASAAVDEARRLCARAAECGKRRR
ncbi:MAG: hypothetical protein ACM30G_12655 [Micromonosporaceae bacterium]